LILLLITFSSGLTQSSTNYQIQKFVIDQGGNQSQSISYRVTDAVGQPSIVGMASSISYNAASGFFSGSMTSTDVNEREEAIVPSQFNLLQNYPNPFNPETIIEYHLPCESEVILTIYDLLGQVVSQPVESTLPAGVHKVYWNGGDDSGQPVATGIYFYRIKMKATTTGDESYIDIKKMIFMK